MESGCDERDRERLVIGDDCNASVGRDAEMRCVVSMDWVDRIKLEEV